MIEVKENIDTQKSEKYQCFGVDGRVFFATRAKGNEEVAESLLLKLEINYPNSATF